MYKYVTDPSSYRCQLIGADRRTIDRTLFNKYGTPRGICVTKKVKSLGPSIRFSFNTTGWPRKHQEHYFRELRVNSIDECHVVYLELVEELKVALKLNHQSYLAIKSCWKDFISGYDHYFD